jgi:hypothetical protein
MLDGKISWTDHVRNKEVLLKSQGAEEYPTSNKKMEGQLDWSRFA